FVLYEAVACVQSGRFVATGGTDRTIKLWNADSGRLIRACRGTSSLITSITFGPGSLPTPCTASTPTRVSAWDLESGEVAPLHENPSEWDEVPTVAVRGVFCRNRTRVL